MITSGIESLGVELIVVVERRSVEGEVGGDTTVDACWKRYSRPSLSKSGLRRSHGNLNEKINMWVWSTAMSYFPDKRHDLVVFTYSHSANGDHSRNLLTFLVDLCKDMKKSHCSTLHNSGTSLIKPRRVNWDFPPENAINLQLKPELDGETYRSMLPADLPDGQRAAWYLLLQYVVLNQL